MGGILHSGGAWRGWRWRRRAVLGALALAVLACGASAAGEGDGPPAVSAIAARLEEEGGQARLLFELTAPVQVSAFPVARPNRIIIDLPEVAFLIDPAVGRPAAPVRGAEPLVDGFRFGQFAPGRSRVVVDLARPAKILRAGVENRPQGARLEIELAAADAASFSAEAERAGRNSPPRLAAPAPPNDEPAAPPAGGGKPVVVIDPGHGGVDHGAAGKRGAQEKEIVLEFSRALAAKIRAAGRLRVVLTRDQDVFIPLEERVRIARRSNAALFLSVHADTLGAPNVEGATVYTVSAKASDAESAKIAEKENRADQAAGLEHKEEAEEVGDILLDLTRRETRAFSRQFAKELAARWKEAGKLNKNPTRSAGFVVLKAHDVPSVLVELGYLSSERDLARLNSPVWREEAAGAAMAAIDAYFAARGQMAGASPAAPQDRAAARPQ